MSDDHSEQVAEATPRAKKKHGHGAQCPRCGSDCLKRMPREGFLQNRVYPIFGYYPWKCTKCLGKFVLRRRNLFHRHHHASVGAIDA